MASSHEEIERFVREHWDEIVSDIAELVSIPSTEDLEAASPDAPWGPGPRRALDVGLGIARRLGLEPHDCKGIIGYADVPGEGTGQIATIAHLDVVPAGPGWDFDPFTVTRREGYLVGRGVLDDKGPAVLTLWTAHYLLRHHDSLSRRVRILLGTNEETGMGGARWYVRNFEAPDFLFTPDASWPVVCGEKGSYNTELSWPLDKNSRILEVSGGTVRNAVASAACAVVRADQNELLSAPRIAVVPLEDGLCRIEATGIGGHAAEPEGTLSAIGVLLNYLLEQGVCSDRERTWLEFEHRVYSSTDGSSFGIQAKDDLFTPLTIISGTIETRDGRFVQTTDCRYPKSTNPDRIAAGMRRTCASYGVELRETHRGNYLYVDPNGPEVQKLLRSYTEWHDGDAHPVTLGGGTYAKRFPHAVAFGPEEPRAKNAPTWVGGIHGPNEAIREDSLKKALCTYIRALELLTE